MDLQLINQTGADITIRAGTLLGDGTPFTVTAANAMGIARDPLLRQLLDSNQVSAKAANGGSFNGDMAFFLLDSVAAGWVTIITV